MGVEAQADVRARLESPGAAATARREESRQCLELPGVVWLVADGPGAVSSTVPSLSRWWSLGIDGTSNRRHGC